MMQIFPNHPIVDQANAMIWNGADAMVVLPSRDVRVAWLLTPRSRDGSEFNVL